MSNGPLRSASTKRLRVLIADDHDAIREQIQEIVRQHPRLEVCAVARDGIEAVEKATELKPDFVILDISMPGLNGLDAATQIRRIVPKAKVIMLSMHESPHLEAAALRAGADTIISKALAGNLLLSAIHRLASADAAEAGAASAE
ncbi:MAG TPA: response regulator transcription factor [Candidatus Acidoferrales bacterium]|nr:response regulator transcription factor [Candidatus Acidoferrales bacterium]